MLKALVKNINILNILLIFIILFVARYTFMPVSEKSIKPKPLGENLRLNESEALKEKKPISFPSTDLFLIAENNPFHPERIIPVEKKTEAPPLPKPEFVLYGTLITEELKVAYLSDEKASISTAGRGKRQIPLRLGETLSGFTLKEIEDDKVLMMRGDEKLYVYLYDSSKSRMREALPSDRQQAVKAQEGKATVDNRQQFTVQTPQTQPQVSVQPPAVEPTKQPITPEQARDVFMKLFQQKK